MMLAFRSLIVITNTDRPATINYSNQTITIPAGQTSRVAIHADAVATQEAQQTYIQREQLSSAPATVGNSAAAATSSPNADADQGELTTTVTRFSTATVTVTDAASSTGAASPSSAGNNDDNPAAVSAANDVTATDDSAKSQNADSTSTTIPGPTNNQAAEASSKAVPTEVESNDPISPVPVTESAPPAAPAAPSTSPIESNVDIANPQTAEFSASASPAGVSLNSQSTGSSSAAVGSALPTSQRISGFGPGPVSLGPAPSLFPTESTSAS